MLVEPLFEENELKSEQRVIIEEMKMTDDSPEEFLGELFSKEFFPGDPLGRPIAGTPEHRHDVWQQPYTAVSRGEFSLREPGNSRGGKCRARADRRISGQCFWLSSSGTNRRPPEGGTKTRCTSAPIIVHQKPDLEQAHI